MVLDGNGKYTKEVLMLPENKRSVTVDNDFHLQLQDNGHVIKIKSNDGTFYYRIDFIL